MVGRSKTPTRARKPTSRARRLSGGNPQIRKGHGEAPVRAYLSALPGWKQKAGRRLDTLITRAVPNVSKAVKYNSPLYGIDGLTSGNDLYVMSVNSGGISLTCADTIRTTSLRLAE